MPAGRQPAIQPTTSRRYDHLAKAFAEKWNGETTPTGLAKARGNGKSVLDNSPRLYR